MKRCEWIITLSLFCAVLIGLTNGKETSTCYLCGADQPCDRDHTCEATECYRAQVKGGGSVRKGCIPVILNGTVDPNFNFSGECKETQEEKICKCKGDFCNNAAFIPTSSMVLSLLPATLMLFYLRQR